MSWVAAAVVGGSIIGGTLSAGAQEDAANTAAGAQTAASQAGIAQQDKQFQAIQALLSPYVTAGNGALTAQQNLLGLNGPEAQQTAYNGVQNSPAFQSAQKLGETSILQNASATGGLRGGNTQAALAQFSPALLTQLIQNQYGNLGGLTSIGQNAAAGVGNAGMSTGNNITTLLGQQGSAAAGAALASGKADASIYNSLGQGLGGFSALGGFGAPINTTGLSSGYSGVTGYAPGADPLGSFIGGLP